METKDETITDLVWRTNLGIGHALVGIGTPDWIDRASADEAFGEIMRRFRSAIETMADDLDGEHAWSTESMQAVAACGFVPSWEREGGEKIWMD